MEFVIAAQAAAIFGLLFVVYQERRAANQEVSKERDRWFEERQVLLNRIKPETAQIVSLAQPEPDPPAISAFDDEEWFEAKQAELERLAS